MRTDGNRILRRDKFLESAVLMPIVTIDDTDYFLLEKRAKNIRQAGEISFPGGKKDKKDKDFMQTAIRETVEELGIKKKNIIKPKKFGTLISENGILIECYLARLNIKNIGEISYNREEVEKLLLVPIKFFMETEPYHEKIEFQNIVKFDVKKYNFTERYHSPWKFKDRKISIFMYDKEPIWGLTAEIIIDFIKVMKEEGKVAGYEYK